ncbi:MAG: hypothetical protein Q4E63_09565, partial [Prevotellaceae bacterium]|nr:hypothetical protein [Prevotellaceae bacterium]
RRKKSIIRRKKSNVDFSPCLGHDVKKIVYRRRRDGEQRQEPTENQWVLAILKPIGQRKGLLYCLETKNSSTLNQQPTTIPHFSLSNL